MSDYNHGILVGMIFAVIIVTITAIVCEMILK